MVLLSLNVWGAAYWAYLLNVFGNMLQDQTTADQFLLWCLKATFVWVIIFFITDNLTWRVKQKMALFWRRQARFWYEERAETNPRKIGHIGQRVVDVPGPIIEKMLDLAINGYRAVIALIVFIPMTIRFSPAMENALYYLTLEKIGFGIYLPWLLIWVLLLTFVIETVVSHYLGRPLSDLEVSKQKTQSLARNRANLSHANNRASQLFPVLRDNHLRRRTRTAIRVLFEREDRQVNKQFWLVGGKSGYSISWAVWPLYIFGYFVAVKTTVSLGSMNQAIAGMNEVHRSLGVIPDSWQQITDIRGGMKLLHEIEK
jgi:ABC-type uncharacterized transport system fused permease/ATPase subunit